MRSSSLLLPAAAAAGRGLPKPSAADALGKVESVKKLPEGTQPGLTPEEVGLAEKFLRADPRICEIAREVGIEPHQLYADGWSIGYDDRFDKNLRVQQCLMYARFSEHENLYAVSIFGFMPQKCGRRLTGPFLFIFGHPLDSSILWISIRSSLSWASVTATKANFTEPMKLTSLLPFRL